MPLPPDNYTHAWYKLYCYLRPENLLNGWDRDRIIYEINTLGFPAFHGGCSEIYKEKCFDDINLEQSFPLKNASLLGETSLMFLVHPTIDEKQMNFYSEAIKQVLTKATK